MINRKEAKHLFIAFFAFAMLQAVTAAAQPADYPLSSPPEQQLDRIVQSRILEKADAIAGKEGLESGEADGRPYARLDGGKTIRLEPGENLAPFDQFYIWIYAGEGASGSLSMNVNMKTRTEGLDAPDSYHSGLATKIDWNGWKKCVFPYEDFAIYGIPDGWNGVDNAQIRIRTRGEVGIGDIGMDQRDRVKGPRLTDKGLFQALNLDYPGLEKIKAAVETGDYERAKTELSTYYDTRKEPWTPYRSEEAPDPNYNTTGADRILSNDIMGQQLPEDFNWRINPIGYLEWMHHLNRQGFLNTLVRAYEKTRQEKYAAKLDYLLTTWMAQNPEPVDHNGGADPAWETLSTSIRMRGAWPRIWYVMQKAKGFRDQTRIAMLKSFWAHAEHLTHYQGYDNNWFVVESAAIATIGIMFPEFKRADVWRTQGYERLAKAIREQVYPDGVQYEISPGYHSMSGGGFAEPYRLAQHNHIAVDSVYTQRLEGMYAYTAYTVRPDFSHPSINDSGGINGSHASWAREGAELFNRPDLLYVGTRGEKGAVPATASKAFDDAGIYVMRQSWDRDARYLLMDAGAYSGGHQHEDKLSFEFDYGGDPLIVDPGIASYLPDPWTAYYRSTRAHNTVLIDGNGQDRRHTQNRAQQIRSVRGENAVQMGHGLDYVISRYNAGYENVPDSVTHHRAILFVRNDYFLVLDRVTGSQTHTIDALFHFAPMRVQIDGNRVRTNREGRKNVELAPLDFGAQLTPRLVTGQNDPVQGWVAENGNKPAPCAIYEQENAALPLDFGWVMAPYATGRSAGLTVAPAKAEGGTAFELTWKDGRKDLLFWRWDKKGAAKFEGYTTDGQGAVIRRNPQGKVTYAGAIEGTYLRGNGLSLSGNGLIEQ